ncbi:MAG: hypothetical protein NZ951_00560 [Dehalococcoidia bacterium]|nr:hypothetical protein [Dehalococcoidia bacterium]MDW8119134.1 hypothetical protein [Chloroflexota bacterium]
MRPRYAQWAQGAERCGKDASAGVAGLYRPQDIQGVPGEVLAAAGCGNPTTSGALHRGRWCWT